MLDNPLKRLVVFQTLNRVWRPFLTSAERDFVMYVLDNSVCWGRQSFRTTVPQMVTGTRTVTPIGLGERTVRRVIGSLQEKGLLQVKMYGVVSLLTVNLEWEPPEMLKLPKRLQGKSPETEEDLQQVAKNTPETAENTLQPLPNWQPTPAKLAAYPCQIGSPNKYSFKNSISKIETRSPSPDGSASSVSQEANLPVRERTRPARQEHAVDAIAAAKAKPKTTRAEKPSNNWTLWRSAWLETFPAGTPIKPWGSRELGMVSSLSKRCKAVGVDFPVFLDWSVRNWREVTATTFKWMDNRPQFPDVRFLVRWVQEFLDAFADHKVRGELSLGMGEDAEYQRLRMAGMQHDEAMVEIGVRRGTSREREALSKDRQEVNRLYRIAERKEKSAALAKPQQAVQSDSPTRRVVVRHGDNPFENGDVDFPEVDDFTWGEQE